MQSPEERIDIIRQAQAKYNANKDNAGLDLDNVSFAAISNADNSELTNLTKEWVDNG